MIPAGTVERGERKRTAAEVSKSEQDHGWTSAFGGRTVVQRISPVSAPQNFTAPTIEDFHDARKQGGSNDGVTLVREMHKVKGTIAQRHLLIVHNHAN